MSAYLSRGDFHFEIQVSVHCRFPNYLRRSLAPAAKAALNRLPTALLREKLPTRLRHCLSLSVVTPKAIQALNRSYRGKNKPTDVLSFSRLEGTKMPQPDIGEVILCWEVAKAQNEVFGTTRKQEVQRLVVHGVLHLFGYDHEGTRSEANRMFRLQEKILRTL